MKPGTRDAANLYDMLEAAREARDLVSEIRAEEFLHDRVRARARERMLDEGRHATPDCGAGTHSSPVVM